MVIHKDTWVTPELWGFPYCIAHLNLLPDPVFHVQEPDICEKLFRKKIIIIIMIIIIIIIITIMMMIIIIIMMMMIMMIMIQIKYRCAKCVSYENGGLRVFSCFVRFLVKKSA